MTTMAPTRKSSDDFDMAKLQKTLKQRQRHAVRNSAHTAKLTPAEIRSLNHNSLTSKTGSQSSTKSISSPSRSRRSTNTTPPVSSDDTPAYQAQAHRNSVSRHNSLNLPTPPQTPNANRRSSQSSTHTHHHHHGSATAQAHANGFIHAPRPRGSAQAAFMSSNGLSSRPSSSGSSTYRGLPTYRGPEVTRTGSVNMLLYPSQQIVNNPLSYFSRPRQSQLSTSPDRPTQEQAEISTYRAQSLKNGRANSLPHVSAPSSRQPSPPRMTDSPVSVMANDTETFPNLVSADDPHNQPKTQSDEDEIQKNPQDPVLGAQFNGVPTGPEEKPDETNVVEATRKEKDKHKRFTVAIFGGGDKSNLEKQENKLKKQRRQTVSWTQKEMASESEAKEKSGSSDSNTSTADTSESDFAAHPAIRPLSLLIPDEPRGKEKEHEVESDTDSTPVYGRCACCGKVKRPHGFSSELSPVLENENLRTNFSFEIERTSGATGRRSSDANRSKFTPIIPMPVGDNETRQARIESWSGTPEPAAQEQPPKPADEIAQSSPVRQSLRHTNMSPARMKRNSASHRLTRFASLHGLRNGDTGPIAEEDEELEGEVDENEPLMSEHGLRTSGVQTYDFASTSGVAAKGNEVTPNEPHVEISSVARAVGPLSVIPNDSTLRTSTDSRDSNAYSSANATAHSSLYHTPAGRASPATADELSLQSPPLPDHETSASVQPAGYHHITTVSAGGRYGTPANDLSGAETPLSATSTTIVITPTATSANTPTLNTSAWEQERSGTFLSVSNSTPAMDLSLRPKFSFESMHSANHRAEMVAGKSTDRNSPVQRGATSTPTGKRKSMAPFLDGVAVKA